MISQTMTTRGISNHSGINKTSFDQILTNYLLLGEVCVPWVRKALGPRMCQSRHDELRVLMKLLATLNNDLYRCISTIDKSSLSYYNLESKPQYMGWGQPSDGTPIMVELVATVTTIMIAVFYDYEDIIVFDCLKHSHHQCQLVCKFTSKTSEQSKI